jgi:hypothetical protein
MMRGLGVIVAVLVAGLLAAAAALAQPAPEPIVRASIDPPRAVVGQPITLRLDVMAPNYMTAPPVMPDFQIRNAVTRQVSRINISERNGATTYAGIRFEFDIFPQEAGSYALTDQSIAVTYAAQPPSTRNATLALPRLSFEAYVPDEARAIDPFVSAEGLALAQDVKRSADPLKVGDAVTRTLTIAAQGTPAMLLPPVSFARIEGTAVYPAQPSLDDKPDARTGRLAATRTDQATYMLEKPGEYVLPAVEIAWWNVRTQSVEHAQAEPIVVRVSANPAAQAGASVTARRIDWDSFVDMLVDHWPAAIALMVLLGLVAWAAPATVRRLAEAVRQRRRLYIASEPWAFAQLHNAARSGQIRRFYRALQVWLERFGPVAPNHTIAALEQAAADPLLSRELAAIEQQLYDQPGAMPSCSPRKVMRRLAAARRRLVGRADHRRRPLIPEAINPADIRSVHPALRPVAR